MGFKNYQNVAKIIERNIVLVASLLAIVCVVTVGNILGPALSFDTNSYDAYSADLLKHNFNFFRFLEEHYPRLATYAVPLYVMSAIKLFVSKYFADSNWKEVFLIFNYFCVTAMLFVFVKTLTRVGISNLAIALAILLMVLSIDHLIWPRFVLTDTMYALLLLITFIQPLRKTFLTGRGVILFIALLVIMMITRPTALPVVLISGVFAFVCHAGWSVFKPKNILLIFAACVLGFALAWSYFFYQYGQGNFAQHKYLDYIYDFIAQGAIVTEREGSSIHFTASYFDFVLLYFLRVMFFFSPISKEFSLIHNICNLIWLGSYALSLVGWVYFMKKGLLNAVHTKILTGVLLLILAVACYHSAILLDYDWRYRYPIILPMLMSVAIVFDYVLRAKSNAKKL